MLVFCVTSLAGCSDGQRVEDPPDGCADEPIDRFKELIVVEPSVVSDPVRASNAASGPWSFRHLMEEMAPAGTSADEFVYRWIQTYTSPTTINLYPVAERESVVPVLLCPWWKQTPSNECDADCLSCAAHELDLAKAPFRLMAISNRIDLREVGSTAGPSGEGRLVFALTAGPGDDPASAPLNMSVIFEYVLPTSDGRDGRYWAERWHALAPLDLESEELRAALQEITDAFTMRGTDPASPDRPSIGQVRTNERAFFWLWQQREYVLEPGGLVLGPTENTPDESINGTEELRAFLLANEEPILEGRHVLPPTLTGGTADQGVTWQASVPDALRNAFAKETCNGCHLTETAAVDNAFHVSPFREGVDRLSPFMNDPADPSRDDLARREASMQKALCGM